MKIRAVVIVTAVALAYLIAHFWIMRWDMTDDHRYSISDCTKHLVQSLDAPMTMTIYLDGSLNPGFARLRKAATEVGEEIHACQPLFQLGCAHDLHQRDSVLSACSLSPTIIHERSQDGRTVQTPVWPYAALTYHERTTYIHLLHNDRGQSAEQNLNVSIENLEYALAEAIYSLLQNSARKIAFLEGHGELPESAVYDISLSLSRYFQIDRGQLTHDPATLNDYQVVIIADPQQPFSESDKYILDQYIMHGGRILWLVNGVRFSQDVLAKDGFTPVISLDLHLSDTFFTYGIRIQPALVQDIQCLPIPVDVSSDPSQPNFQPMPWYYAPLLLTSQYSAITRNLGQLSSTFVSYIDAVGDDSLRRDILLATSTASRIIPTPAEVDLSDLNPDIQTFCYQYIPVAILVEGTFSSAFHHRLPPDSIAPHHRDLVSPPTKQIFVASGSIIRNDWEKGQPLPVGYDRYTGRQFANRDFLTNAVLYLADDQNTIELRNKNVALRLLNDRHAHQQRLTIQIISVLLPIVMLALTGGIVTLIRRRKYIHT